MSGEGKVLSWLSVSRWINSHKLFEARAEIILVGISDHGADLLKGVRSCLKQQTGLFYPNVRDISADVLLLVFFKERAQVGWRDLNLICDLVQAQVLVRIMLFNIIDRRITEHLVIGLYGTLQIVTDVQADAGKPFGYLMDILKLIRVLKDRQQF